MAQAKKIEQEVVEQTEKAPVPQWKLDHPEWEWDRKCLVCKSACAMENPEIYNIEVYECQKQSCRAQFTLEVFYDLKTGKLLREEFKGQTMGALNG